MSDELRGFPGFRAGKTRLIPIPAEFFGELMPIIDDLDEMKAVLYLLWQLAQGEGDVRYLRLDDALSDWVFLQGLGETPEEQEKRARAAFARAAQRGALIEVEVERKGRRETWYFLNSFKGRQAVDRLRRGEFEGLIHDIDDVVVGLQKERPNIFLLYEQNIGMITPLLAEKLRQAERDYPQEWLRDAFAEAVAHNKRNWAYIQRILENWTKHGKQPPSHAARLLIAGDGDDLEEYGAEALGIIR